MQKWDRKRREIEPGTKGKRMEVIDTERVVKDVGFSYVVGPMFALRQAAVPGGADSGNRRK